MTKEFDEKYFDVRSVGYYTKKGEISKKDIETHFKNLPNDEDNFELVTIDEDFDCDPIDNLTDEEIESMPELTEDALNNFDFMETKSDNQESSDTEAPVKPATETQVSCQDTPTPDKPLTD